MAEIKFISREHENFYKSMLQKSGNSDSYHRAFFYCIGISDTTRRNAERIFDFERDRIKPDGLHEGWQTGGTLRLTRLAFNLWNGYVEPGEERMSTPYEMFDCSYAPISMKPYAYAIRNIAGIYRKTVKRAAGRKDNAFGNFTGTGNKEVRQWGKRLRQGQSTEM